MIEGLDVFRAHFADFTDQYVLIGGAACDLWFEEAAVDFRATRDLDLVLTLETEAPAFGRRFWEFVRDGGYESFIQTDGKMRFFRFLRPKTPGFPSMLELFSQNAIEGMAADQRITPLPLGDDISSLSAILLNADYIELLHQGRGVVSGISVLSAPCLIPFKARAWLDLTARKAAGERVDGDDIRKHRNDILRLVTLLREHETVALPQGVKHDMTAFLEALETTPPDRSALKTFGLGTLTFPEILQILRATYL